LAVPSPMVDSFTFKAGCSGRGVWVMWWSWHVAVVGSCIDCPSVGLVIWLSQPLSSEWWGPGSIDVHGYWLVVHALGCVSGIVLRLALLGSLGSPLIVILVRGPLLVEVVKSSKGTALESSVWSQWALLCLMLVPSSLPEEVLEELR
jgi:hypothetical protein